MIFAHRNSVCVFAPRRIWTSLLLFGVCSVLCLGCSPYPGAGVSTESTSQPVPSAHIVPISETTIRLLPGSSGSLVWKVQNRGKELLKINNLSASCGCAKPRIDDVELAAGATTRIWLDFKGTELGTKDHVLRVETNDPVNQEIVLPLRSIVRYPIEVFPANLNFVGNVGQSVVGEVVVRPNDNEPLKILSIDCLDASVSYEIASSTEKNMRLQFRSPISDASRRTTMVQLHLDHSLGAFSYDIPIMIVAHEAPNIVPQRVLLNDCRPGAVHQLTFTMTNAEHLANVQIGNSVDEGSPFRIVRYSVNRTESNTNRVSVQLSIGDSPGYHAAAVEFHFEDLLVESVPLSGFISASE